MASKTLKNRNYDLGVFHPVPFIDMGSTSQESLKETEVQKENEETVLEDCSYELSC